MCGSCGVGHSSIWLPRHRKVFPRRELALWPPGGQHRFFGDPPRMLIVIQHHLQRKLRKACWLFCGCFLFVLTELCESIRIAFAMRMCRLKTSDLERRHLRSALEVFSKFSARSFFKVQRLLFSCCLEGLGRVLDSRKKRLAWRISFQRLTDLGGVDGGRGVQLMVGAALTSAACLGDSILGASHLRV